MKIVIILEDRTDFRVQFETQKGKQRVPRTIY